MLRLPHSVDSWVIDGTEFISLMCQPPFYSQDDSWYSFLFTAEPTSVS
jgi:hypothetical protein